MTHQRSTLAAERTGSSDVRVQKPLNRSRTSAILQRLEQAPQTLRPADVLQLQRTIGNRATGQLLQAKLKLGPAGDRYEQEADQVAKQVVRASRQPDVQREEGEEGAIQTSRYADSISTLQRNSVPARSGFFVARPPKPKVQRDEMDDALQASPNHGLEGGDVDTDVARSIQSAKGGGQPLHDGVRSSMEKGFGADFGGVQVHTGGQADALNRSLNARAFTTGKDIFFGKGQYNPGSTGGQELIAHELTHTVQQGAAGAQRQPELIQPYRIVNYGGYSIGDEGARFESQKLARTNNSAGYITESKSIRDTVFGLESEYKKRDLRTGTVLEEIEEERDEVTSPPLKVSNDGALAIENSDGEAKLFYATDGVVDASNTKLGEIGSPIALQSDASQTLEVPDIDDTMHEVKMVRPTYRGALQEAIGSISICTNFVKNILGATDRGSRVAVFQRAQWQQGLNTSPQYEAPVSDNEQEPIKQIAGYVASDDYQGAPGLVDELEGFSERDTDRDTGEVIREQQTLSRSRKGGRSRELGINEYANAEVGEGYVISSMRERPDDHRFSTQEYLQALNRIANGNERQKAALDKNIRALDHLWGIHYAGVVAKSGSDSITLENYNREQVFRWELDTLINNLLTGFENFRGITQNAIDDETFTDINQGIPVDSRRRIAEMTKVITMGSQLRDIGGALEQRLQEYANSYQGMRVDQNKLYHFKMYGQQEGQTFHEQWKGVTENATTLRIRESGSIIKDAIVGRIQNKVQQLTVTMTGGKGDTETDGIIDTFIRNVVELGDEHILLLDQTTDRQGQKGYETQFGILLKREAQEALHRLFYGARNMAGQQANLNEAATSDEAIALIDQWILANEKFAFSRDTRRVRTLRNHHLAGIRKAIVALKAATAV